MIKTWTAIAFGERQGCHQKQNPSRAILTLAATESPKGIDREGKELKLS